MSADFWAGYISGAAGILIGNPLDLIKVRLQAASRPLTLPGNLIPQSYPTALSTASLRYKYLSQFSNAGSLIRGVTAPILGYGALNALLFMTYNRTSNFLSSGSPTAASPTLWTTWIAGAIGGLAIWVVSTPTELIKCRAQMAPVASPILATSALAVPVTSWQITREIVRVEGVRGLYFGGIVTALRDSIGYGFYFWSYELSSRLLATATSKADADGTPSYSVRQEAAKVLFCGGLAGVITWASIFPLDVIKTRVQTQMQVQMGSGNEAESLLGARQQGRLGAVEVAKMAYRQEGPRVFFRGLAVCSVRAFIVNAAQWAVYEWIMRELKHAEGAPP